MQLGQPVRQGDGLGFVIPLLILQTGYTVEESSLGIIYIRFIDLSRPDQGGGYLIRYGDLPHLITVVADYADLDGIGW